MRERDRWNRDGDGRRRGGVAWLVWKISTSYKSAVARTERTEGRDATATMVGGGGGS